MPKGVEVVVQDGFATVDFVDRSLRGPALAEFRKKFGAGIIEPQTRSGPRKTYRMPADNARELGLLDSESETQARVTPDTGFATALVEADPVAAGGEWHNPTVTVKGNAYVGATPTADVLGNTSPASTISGEEAALVVTKSSQQLIEENRARGNPFVVQDGTAVPDGGTEETESQAAPAMSWSRKDLNKAAADAGVVDPEKLGNKEEVLSAIEKATQKS